MYHAAEEYGQCTRRNCNMSCTPDDFKCQSSIGWDCYTAPDLSFEERACDGDWTPIYTGEDLSLIHI